jgi:hypothetical protein
MTALFDRNGIDACELLKMDCEGAEFLILASTPDYILARCNRIVMEYHLTAENREMLATLLHRLENLGFRTKMYPTSEYLGIATAVKSRPAAEQT